MRHARLRRWVQKLEAGRQATAHTVEHDGDTSDGSDSEAVYGGFFFDEIFDNEEVRLFMIDRSLP